MNSSKVAHVGVLTVLVLAVAVGCGFDDRESSQISAPSRSESPVDTASLQTYFVAPWGNDDETGDFRNPWRSIQKAVDTAQPGSTVLLNGGEYEPFVVRQSGLRVAPVPGDLVVVRGASSAADVVLIAADDVSVSRITVAGCVPDQGSLASDRSGIRIDDGANGVKLSSLVVRDSYGSNAEGMPIGCHGILIHNAANASVSDSDIFGNGDGIYVEGGENNRITNNKIHDNNVLIRNTGSIAGDDFGSVGIYFSNVKRGAVAARNEIYNNSGPSQDYGSYGSAVGIFDSSYIAVLGSNIFNNERVLETGASGGGDCANNVFDQNSSGGRVDGSTLERSQGLLLRCARGMRITNNSFRSLDGEAFQIGSADPYATSVAGLSITTNNVEQGSAPAYRLGLPPSELGGVQIDNNKYRITEAFADTGSESVASLEAWQALTGFDVESTAY